MSALARIHANGGDVVRHEWRFALKRGALSADAIKWIKANMDEVRREVWPAYDDWEERAAIREHDGGQDRADAEADAYLEFANA